MSHVPFWNTPYPFKDFLLISSTKGDLNNQVVDNIDEESKKNNLYFKKIYTYENISNYILTNNINESLYYINENILAFSGVAQFSGDFYFGQNSISRESELDDDFFNSVGIFTSMKATKQEIIIKQDYFGCGILYYFKGEDYSIVSNRYHLLLLILSWIGHKGKINMAKVMSKFYYDTNFFDYNISHQMEIQDVFQLPIEKYIKIDENGFKIEDREDIINSLQGKSNESYDEMLLKAKEEIISNIECTINSNIFEKYITDLSGGMDSRLVFGGILNVKDSIDKVEIRAVNTPKSDDLKIATSIKKLFGYKFLEEEFIDKYPTTIENSLNMWISYFMGNYHRMGFSAWTSQGNNFKEIRFAGGMGEAYRSSWYELYKNQIGTPKSVEELVYNFMNSFNPSLKYAHKYKEEICELLIHDINNMAGNSCIEKFENHYLNFGLRYHFGMRASEYYQDKTIWFPLVSKSALTASRMIDIEDRVNNRFMLELTEKLNPILVYIDYDSKKASENELLNKITFSNPKFKDYKVQLADDIKGWNEVQEINKSINKKYPHNNDKKFYQQWANINDYIYDEVIKSYYKIKSYNIELDNIFDLSFLRYIEINKNNSSKINNIYSKINSIIAQIEIFNQEERY